MLDRADPTVPVYYAEVRCTGSESSLLDCNGINNDTSNFGLPGNTYNHALDVFIVCRPTGSSVNDYSGEY